jgi:3(or 17)beta-hydroxysteroid dehydrogenase
MTKSIAIYCRQAGLSIRCNSIHPGSISTPMVHTALKTLLNTDLMAEEDPEATRKALGIGEPDDVAHMVVYLMSDESKHVTGTEMVIDNGDTVI